MLSKQQNAASSMEGDAWTMSFVNVEDMLLARNCRRRCYSILKTLRDKHLDFANSPITNYILKTLLLFECEKHPKESEWGEVDIGDRIIGKRALHEMLTQPARPGILLQLVSCLQCRRCPHYFIQTVDLFRGKPAAVLEQSAKQSWQLVREIILNSRALERL
jgi:hypothetical protein